VPGNAGDGSGATEGSSAALKVAQRCVPWTKVNWDEALAACQAYDAACHLLEDDEWTALAVWSMLRGVTVYGNNSNGKDVDDQAIAFQLDSTHGAGRSLTGTGTSVGWSVATNLTTHTGTSSGVYDLNGNVSEWTATLFGQSNRYFINGSDTGISMPANGQIKFLSTNTRVRRYGLPGSTDGGLGTFGKDRFSSFDFSMFGLSGSTSARRGGIWSDSADAGVWSLDLQSTREYKRGDVGFRPSLRY
jgi:hypothetical protein